MDYIYLGDRMTDPKLKGESCCAIRNKNGKCIRSKKSTMLVGFKNNIVHNVLARRLRKIK